jgi:hypothetical protein
MARLSTSRNHTIAGFAVVLLILLPFYLITLQTIPNGAEHYYMIDVGEMQIVLNKWGTLHATGYPLYTIIGNVLTTIMRGVSLSPAVAPGLVSLIWSMIALGLIYVLAVHLTERPYASAAMTILFGLTRTVWIHASIAEIYSFGLVFLALLLLLALWKKPIRGRIYWLALVGGLGVFHHRALLMVAPALLYAVWPELTAHPRRIARMVVVSLLIGALGFLPYLYLPLRANAGAAWVYGEPGTWGGFWDQFSGREASRFIGAPASFEGLVANFHAINVVLVTDVTVPGIILGLLGLALALRTADRRRAAMTMLISGGAAYLFHTALYTDILLALILPILLSIAFGWLYLVDRILYALSPKWVEFALRRIFLVTGTFMVFSPTILFGYILISQNLPFIHDLTTDTTGLETITLAEGAPPGSTLMLDWGPRYFAVGFARDVLGELPGISLVDHKADFASIVSEGSELVTPDFTFYNRPVNGWENALGTKVYLQAAAPHLIAIHTQPDVIELSLSEAINVIDARVECTSTGINLHIDWASAEKPEHDLSVFVHLLDTDANVIGQGDQAAPVYGWRPLTTWAAGEVIHDIYPLPRAENAAAIQYGLYRQTETGAFENEFTYEIPVECEE